MKGKTTTATSANGLTRTVQLDLDGNATNDLTEVDATVVNGDGSRTKTVTKTNKDGSLRDRAVTTTSADGRAKSTQTDRNGDSVVDLTLACAIAVLADGSSISTETTTNNDGTQRGKVVTSLSADGLSRTTQSDVTGDGVFDSTTTDVTVVNAGGRRTQTVSTRNANGSLRERTITEKGADARSRTIQSDLTGDAQQQLRSSLAPAMPFAAVRRAFLPQISPSSRPVAQPLRLSMHNRSLCGIVSPPASLRRKLSIGSPSKAASCPIRGL